MLHLSRLPSMSERVSILQAQFLFRSLYIPEDTLLRRLHRIFNTLEDINGISFLRPRFGRWCHPPQKNSILVYPSLSNGSSSNKT
ncbi:hypothetical protein G6F57_005951 [Rhizopus arrhizus]|uniref:Uncharacterized protein n=1 Tax=Rhizopus oryzae TaxID=64495 RepID=A0A9P6X4U3_RHIOR|nr:hypothetical protein G6F23_005355 [Rhizopus arrhizus]KAG1255498.1 hypothetical protein G6F68_010329 [Rhizopus microsporus]KAG1399037.1 hypothetical protein G6F58_011207 [Rhizopus delemar]KAG0760221.1 hypothetical protein G6F24_008485 [Rhizopus arrhizus]KAG0788062.1 hypothetical protein G6F21_007475 [Rhizopus arrhizus]